MSSKKKNVWELLRFFFAFSRTRTYNATQRTEFMRRCSYRLPDFYNDIVWIV